MKRINIFVKTSVKSFVKTLSLNVKYFPPTTLKQPSCWSMILKKYLINILWIFQSTCCPAYFGNLHNFSVQDFFKFHPGEKYFLIFFCLTLREKCPNTEFFSGPYFPVFGLNTEIFSVSLRIYSECGKIRTRKNSTSGHFSRSVNITQTF